MTIGLMTTALLVVGAQVAIPPTGESSIDSLAWLSGEWEQREQAAADVIDWTVERWSWPRAGVMLGTSLSGRRASGRDRLRAFEFIRIATGEDGRVTYFASPGGQPAVAFPLARMGRYEVVFENAAHDYPQRIVYRREANSIAGESLTATISMIDGSRPMSWTYRRLRPQP